MTVIGRLDEQVDDVLIEPLSKKGERAPAREDAPAQPSAPRPTGSESPADAAPSPERPTRELPVWML